MASKEEILEAAHMVFAQYGIEKTTLDDIAKECGFKQQALYYYFKNKDDLIEQLMYHIIDDIKKETFDDLKNIQDPVEKIRRYMINQLYSYKKHKRFIDTLRKTDIPMKYLDMAEEIKQNLFSSTYEKIKEIINEGIEKKLFQVDSIDSLIYLLISTTTGYGYTILVRDVNIDIEEIVEKTINIILQGIQK
ncbi:MAG: TetR/AcrR family transcriptional regulator [Candidatus Cloacimonetes bacterium]|nr:TetR/AcrR family transcriptional regulator [Candidatus Cloacimonadota bacterium]